MSLLQMAAEALAQEIGDFEGEPEAVVIFVFGGQDARHLAVTTKTGIKLAAAGLLDGVQAFIDSANRETGGSPSSSTDPRR